MSATERGSPRRTPVRRARTSQSEAVNPRPRPAGGGRGLFAQVEEQPLQLPFTPSHRGGLDSGLAKACPDAEGLNQKSYRSYRRRLELFEKQCERRGHETMVEGAYLVVSRLKDVAWDATEQLDFDDIENATKPFKAVFRLLDELYQYEDLIEVPSRCDEFFSEFGRNKGEELQAYLIRHKTLLKRMKEVNVEVPPLLSGWHLLTRAGVPRWTHVQIKAMCSGDLEYEKVGKALIRMFGGDHRPNARDLVRGGANAKDEAYYEEEAEEDWYDEFMVEDGYEPEWYDDEAYFEEDEEIPEELEEAMELTDEAYVSYVESRKRMKELALSRGFYPVVALGPDFEKSNYKGGKGDSGKGGKGKGKNGGGKGKGKSKGKGGGFFRKTPFNRRPMSGLRKPFSSTSTSTGEKSTLSGSTSQHGPRFKRYRSQNQGVKEVPEEITMVEEVAVMQQEEEDMKIDEQCFFLVTEKGKAIVDSGATRTIVGEENWRKWLEAYDSNLAKKIISRPVKRSFKFGGGEMLQSLYEVEFEAVIHGQKLPVIASVVPGATPFLLARPTLESWGVIHDYREGRMKIGDSSWFTPERNARGHYILDLMMYKDDNENEEAYGQFELDDEKLGSPGVELIDEPNDTWDIEPQMELEMENVEESRWQEMNEVFDVDETANEVLKRLRSKRKLKFFEVYVDQGNLAVHLATKYDDVEASTFSLPEWDFQKKEVRAEFIELLREVSPEFVWVAPPCRKWSAIQRLNRRTKEQQKKLKEEREKEERSHLSLVSEVAKETKKMENNYAMEHPHGAESWKTNTMEEMRGYFEGICDRCRTGLFYDGPDACGPVRKQTRIRSSSREVAEALHLPCQCEERHVPMEGRTRALQKMQNYEEEFVKRAADVIYKEMDRSWLKKEMAMIMVAEEVEEQKKKKKEAEVDDGEKEMSKTHSKVAKSIVEKLHKQLGHPGRDKLVVAVREGGFDENVIQAAREHQCDICQNFRAQRPPKPSALPQASHFNEVLEKDVFHIKWNDEKKKVLAVIDIFSKYEMNSLVESETEKAELQVLEAWINVFGPPKRLRTDAAGSHMSEAYQSYMDDRNIKLELVPKEAHHRMGTVERLHAVRRMQLLNYNN